MRLHMSLDDELVREVDRRVGRGRRSAFIAAAVRTALDDHRHRDLIESGIGVLSDGDHAWDRDPADWVRAQRRADAERVG